MKAILTVTLNPAVDVSSETDTVFHTRKVRTFDERYDPGGGGINVARVVARLGGQVEAVFAAGGETGAMLQRLVEEEGVACRRVAIQGQTRISCTVRERKTGLEYRFVPKGPKIDPSELEPCIEAVASHQGGFVVVSGSLPDGAPPDIYARMARAAASRGARFVLDSSGVALREVLQSVKIFLVKPSLSELEELTGEELDESGVQRAAAGLVERGTAELVAVTLGSKGALLASAGGILRLPGLHVSAHSAVGAGDSFLGAMIWALAEGWAREDAFRLAIAAGAAAVLTPGTELCRRSDVFDLYRRIGPGEAEHRMAG
jgi:6-phosphofructokinase 2